jgi:hypothetical protein
MVEPKLMLKFKTCIDALMATFSPVNRDIETTTGRSTLQIIDSDMQKRKFREALLLL